jgi:hypothetical protein
MCFRPFFPDVLADLKIAEPVNHQWPNDQSREQSGEARERSTKREISENSERREVMKEF